MEVTNFQRRYFCRNFILMTIVQITCMFNFYLLSYLVNLFEQVYVTGILVMSADIISQVIAGCIFEKLGAKVSLASFYAISGIGGIVMLLYGLQHTDSVAFPIIFLICRFGISGVFLLLVASNARIFDI